MNWMITRPKIPIGFVEREPICMIAPQRRGELERVHPSIADLRHEPELHRQYLRFRDERRAFQSALNLGDDDAGSRGWQRDYFMGRSVNGDLAPDHQTRLSLRSFHDERPGRKPAT